MRGSPILLALAAPVFAFGIASAAHADDPRDPTMTPEAIARDRAVIRKLNQDQLAYVRKRDAQYAEGWKAYRQSPDARRSSASDDGARDYAEARRQYEADLARWRRDVAACRAGDYSRCR
ncbi:hypothetical protein EDF56_103245 [Novosphingobium sp. PhB165]|uniref:hypothetical protein n=1 Tax=Novosphingobium sp. PhB165 TaxID=2485105 RepID=UPI00105214DC|nr:hypothetical protein [Novosphingobium sp. PhB165]TCM19602.1 hypothetical protein EDF56_103245 [Novosphingobium sp. PhB165]